MVNGAITVIGVSVAPPAAEARENADVCATVQRQALMVWIVLETIRK